MSRVKKLILELVRRGCPVKDILPPAGIYI
jgi:hypothetical protein